MACSAQQPQRLTCSNAVLLLVDHQVGLYTGVRGIDVLQRTTVNAWDEKQQSMRRSHSIQYIGLWPEAIFFAKK